MSTTLVNFGKSVAVCVCVCVCVCVRCIDRSPATSLARNENSKVVMQNNRKQKGRKERIITTFLNNFMTPIYLCHHHKEVF